jgi:hypothetical protein
VIFVSFSKLFLGVFRSSIFMVFSLDFFKGVMGECLVPFLDDLDPLNAGIAFDLWFFIGARGGCFVHEICDSN